MITIVSDDITLLSSPQLVEPVEVIVNAANSRLMPGGGVCGAIYRAAGPALLEDATRAYGGCKTGRAVITSGFNLCKYIVHAVGPRYEMPGSERLLYEAYTSSMRLVEAIGAKSVAFPCISTGTFGFPAKPASFIATEAVLAYLDGASREIDVTFCVFGGSDEVRQYARVFQLVWLYRAMHKLTLPECGSCKVPYSCCSKSNCDIAASMAAEMRGLEFADLRNENGLFLGESGCMLPAHARPLCTVHTCQINSLGTKPGDAKFDSEYFALRERIDEAEWKYANPMEDTEHAQGIQEDG